MLLVNVTGFPGFSSQISEILCRIFDKPKEFAFVNTIKIEWASFSKSPNVGITPISITILMIEDGKSLEDYSEKCSSATKELYDLITRFHSKSHAEATYIVFYPKIPCSQWSLGNTTFKGV